MRLFLWGGIAPLTPFNSANWMLETMILITQHSHHTQQPIHMQMLPDNRKLEMEGRRKEKKHTERQREEDIHQHMGPPSPHSVCEREKEKEN